MVQDKPKVFRSTSPSFPSLHLDMSGSDQDDPQMTLDCLSATVLGQIKEDGNPVTAEEILGTTQRLHSQLGEQRTKIQSGTIAVDVCPPLHLSIVVANSLAFL